MITGVNHITLAVRDLDRSYQFYVETLGSRPLARWSKGAYLLLCDLWLCLTLDERTRSSPPPEYSHIAVNVPAARFEDAAASIRASGAAVWQDTRSEGASLYFLDPDGHKLEIHAGGWRTRLARMKKGAVEENIQYFDPTGPAQPVFRRPRSSPPLCSRPRLTLSGELVIPAKSGNLGREAHRLSRTPAFREGDGYDTGITHVGDR